MARNPVASNLLMIIVLVAGFLAAITMKQEVFPAFDLDVVSVSVPFPGASPNEVEQGIVLAIEESVRGIDGVKRVSSVSVEGVGAVTATLLLEANPEKVLADVKTAVDRLQSLPVDAERPNVSLVTRDQEVISLVISGDQDLATLHALGERARNDLLALDAITVVELQGVRPREISIEVPQEALEAYGFTLDEIAMQVRASSLELPGGSLKTEGGELLLRVDDRREAGHEYADVLLRSTQGGAHVRLGDIAILRDGYEDTDTASYYNGKRAVRVVAYRVGEETPQQVSDAVRAYRESLVGELPPNIETAIWNDDSEILADRISLLVRNAGLGLILVFLVLTAFLELRLAIWVGLGIPISFMGAFLLMPVTGMSVNLITLFAFIVTLGMVVDDAIIVGENIYAMEQAGMDRLTAAITGAREMSVPVTFSILTTMAAFSPMFFVPGFMGKIFSLMPTVVILVLTFSLIESFLILPAHLGHGTPRRTVPKPLRAVARFQGWVSALLQTFTTRIFAPTVRAAVDLRYAVAGLSLALFVFTVGLVGSGWVPFNFFPMLEGDVVRASARLPFGVSVDRTREIQSALEASARGAIEANGGDAVFRGMYSSLGMGPPRTGPGGGGRDAGGHLVTVEVQLVGSGDRDFSAQEFAEAWTALTPEMAGIEALVFNSNFGPGAGAAVDLQLSHPDSEVLGEASVFLAEKLRTYTSLTDVENDWAAGKPQLNYHLKPEGAALGLTGNSLARQLRASFFGAEAIREQRGRDEVRVMVRLPEDQRRSEYDVEELLIRSPTGGLVPLEQVADYERGHSPTQIAREDGARIINVKAALAAGVPSSRDVLASLEKDVYPALYRDYPGLTISKVGASREQEEAFASLKLNGALALMVMFTLLAVPFKSYVQPLIVMAAIPMGVVGAVGGHVLMGYEMSVISVFGLVALAGVVVNDSLVLIDATNRKRRAGATPREAVVYGASRRLRPILLTSLTTFFGLMPMIFETSVQARFLIPMAISLGFGVMFATVIILLLVPAVYLIVEDLSALARRLWRVLFVSADASVVPQET